MFLREYLHKNNIIQSDFAHKIGVSIPTLSLILNGKNTHLDIAMKIYEGTKKQVTPMELWEEIQSGRLKSALKTIEAMGLEIPTMKS